MNCTNCGAENKDGVKFCTNCGANLSQQTAQNEPEQEQTPTESMDIPATPEGPVPLQKRNTQRTIAIACGVLILLVVVFVGGLFLWKSSTPKELLLDADTIKDEAILNTLTVKYDKDGDGKLSEEELDEVQTLELDSGNDYSFLPFFKNLSSVTVKSSNVTSLDLSENNNLKSADFSNASNITDIKLPDMISYDEVKLPDNENLEVSFPENSEYEVKYVPKKVEETALNYGYEFQYSFEQEVESSTVIRSFSESSFSELTANSTKKTSILSYSNDGKIEGISERWNGVGLDTVFKFNADNQITNEVIKSVGYSSGSSNSNEASYEADGQVSALWQTGRIVYENKRIQFNANPNLEQLWNLWEFDGEHLSQFCSHAASNGPANAKHDYDWIDGSLVQEKLTIFNGNLNEKDNEEILSSDVIQYSYEGSLLKTAKYDSGFTQNFEYDNHGNLLKVTSSGKPNSQYLYFTTKCDVEYTKVIAKKSEIPLSFISLPGLNNSHLVNTSTKTRKIAIGLNGFTGSEGWDFFTQDFTGKFWWDEENIINNQVEAAKARQSLEASNTTADSSSAS